MILTLSDSLAPTTLIPEHIGLITFQEEQLSALWATNRDAYGRALGAMLLGPPEVATGFAQARAVAQEKGLLLRIRLNITADMPDLIALHWETLRDPHDDLLIAVSPQMLFTRHMHSNSWQRVTLRAKRELRALVVIASPANLDRHGLPAINVQQEQAHVSQALATITTSWLVNPGEASLAGILTALEESFDILYVVAHGDLTTKGPCLLLDDGNGEAALVPGTELVAGLSTIRHRPRLIFLASCESAGEASGAVLSALGPRLAIAGIPAIIAMQGLFSTQTNAQFAASFFADLLQEGAIDVALAKARRAIAKEPDWWAPVLFTRLSDCRIWYEPGFRDTNQDSVRWQSLINTIKKGTCTAILGPGLLDSYIGSTREIAQRLAELYRFPLAPAHRDDLPHVAQYLAVRQSRDLLQDEIASIYRAALAMLQKEAPRADKSPNSYFFEIGQARRAVDPYEPHRVLAQLNFPIYVTVNPDRMLSDALLEAQRIPRVLICPWNTHTERAPHEDRNSIVDTDPATGQDAAYTGPLVYHLFGQLDDPESLVLTEDDYFRFLIGITRNDELLPKQLVGALSKTALFFLGFTFDDTSFRVIFQILMNQEGKGRRANLAHVAVQIDPQEGAMIDPQAARDYLISYFGITSAMNYQTNISIYWGSSEDFVRDLVAHMGSGR